MEKEHKDRLQRAWRDLLNTVGDVMRVIDGLFARNVITHTMKERIVQGNAVDSDKLRALMDLLPKRGPGAFDAFYDVLIEQEEFDAADSLKPELKTQPRNIALSQTRDDALPEKWPDREMHDPDHIKVSTITDKEMIQNFENAFSDNSMYPMWRVKRGIFLLIDNWNFETARAAGMELDDRHGTEFDQRALHSLFEGLHFNIEIQENCSATQIADVLQEVARKSHRNFDCFACAILSHGEQGVVYGVDGDTIFIKDIIEAVDGENCPTLIGKPKLFFVQACQGTKNDKGVSMVTQADAAEDMPTGDDVSTGNDAGSVDDAGRADDADSADDAGSVNDDGPADDADSVDDGGPADDADSVDDDGPADDADSVDDGSPADDADYVDDGSPAEDTGSVDDAGSVDDVSTVASHMRNMNVQEELDVEDLYNIIGDVMDVEQCDVPKGKTGTKCDIFLAMATSPDYVSMRNTAFGSWFIQAVAFVFSKFAHKYDLLNLMTKVNHLVSIAETRERGYKQVSGFDTKLRKTFYFFPGLTRKVPPVL